MGTLLLNSCVIEQEGFVVVTVFVGGPVTCLWSSAEDTTLATTLPLAVVKGKQ